MLRRSSSLETFLNYALERGLVSKDGRIYKFHPEDLGLDYSLVQAQIITNEAADFLEGFARWSQDNNA